MHLDYKFETKAIQNAFRKLADLGGDMTPITRKAANVLWQESETAFDREQTPEGEKWTALDKSYEKSRHKNGYTGKKLQVTGNLVNSLDIDYGDSFAVIGAAEPYAQYHQAGTSKMASREFLGLGKDGENEILAIIKRELENALSAP